MKNVKGTYLLNVICNYEGSIEPHIVRINSYKQLCKVVCDKMMYPLVDLDDVIVTKRNFTEADEEEGREIGYDFFNSYAQVWEFMKDLNEDADEYFKLYRIHKGTKLEEIV